MKLSKLERMIAKGMIHCNEAAAVVSDAGSAPDTGGASSDAGSTGGGDSGINWGEMFADADDSAPSSEPSSQSVESQPGVTEQAAPVPAATDSGPVAAVPAQQPPVTPQSDQGQPTAAQQPEPGKAPEQQQPQQPQRSAAEIEAERAQARQVWVDELTKSYALSDEQATMFLTNPGQIFPQMAADMHVRVMENTMQFLRQSLPEMLDQQMRANAARTEGENLFFSEWPELRGKEALVAQIGQTWRQNNPMATREEFIKQVGALAWSAAGLTVQDLLQRGQKAEPVPAAPAAPAGGYSPAPQQTGATMPSAAPSNNPFAQIADDWLKDD